MTCFTQQKRTLFLVIVGFIIAISNPLYAQTKQTNVRYEPCIRCNGTGKNLCTKCGGNKCALCNYSGVQSLGEGWSIMGVPNEFTCPFCKGTGKQGKDTRFDGCFQTFEDVGLESDKTFLCPETHPIGRVVIVDKFAGGKILKVFTKAEWDQREADKKAKKASEQAAQASMARSRASIQTVIMQNMAPLRKAYVQHMRGKPRFAEGKVMVKFEINEFGKIISAQVVESDLNDSEFETTVVTSLKTWDFGKVDKKGDITEVTYPFNFVNR